MKNIMRYKEYYATINYEEETSTFYGKIEDIDDLVSFESDNVKGLKAEFENEVSKLSNNIVSLKKDIELKESELKSLNNVISSKDLEIKTLTKENKHSKK